MHQAIAEISSNNKNLYSLHIPRASLNSSSSSGASSISRSREFSPNLIHQKRHGRHTDDIGKAEIESEWDEQSNANTFSEEDGKKPSARQKGSQKYFVHKVRKANLTATQSSSSSSSASNQSNHSVNSLLLSVKNLENFNSLSTDNVVNSNKIYNTSDNLYRKQMLENIKNILAIDSAESKNNKKKKEPDQISTSSTATNTNFTGKYVFDSLLLKWISGVDACQLWNQPSSPTLFLE
ncbi:hypothetical protein ACKWTF_007771 [Chironomus riparius]